MKEFLWKEYPYQDSDKKKIRLKSKLKIGRQKLIKNLQDENQILQNYLGGMRHINEKLTLKWKQITTVLHKNPKMNSQTPLRSDPTERWSKQSQQEEQLPGFTTFISNKGKYNRRQDIQSQQMFRLSRGNIKVGRKVACLECATGAKGTGTARLFVKWISQV